MLTNINLKNFKSFKNLNNLKIKPITILCGMNSCGKSSILQSLLLLKQTKESRNQNHSLLLNGKYVHLGDLGNVIYGSDKNEELSLSYEYTFTADKLYKVRRTRRNLPILFHLRQIIPDEVRKLKGAEYKIIFDASLKVSEKSKGYIKAADIRKYNVSINVTTQEGDVIPGASVLIEKGECDFSLKWNNINERHRANRKDKVKELLSGDVDGLIVTFENLYPLIDFKRDDEDLFDKIPFEVNNFIRTIEDFVLDINEGISYIGPLREEPSRRYIYENEVLEIGIKGENAAYIYQTEQEKPVFDHYFLEKNDRSNFTLTNKLTLSKALEKWLGLMNIKGFKPDFQSEIIRLEMDSNSCVDARVNIADVGFGVSQIFPILLEGLRMQKNGTFLLEQPEIHLHPSLQMQMADYFVSLALSNKNVIVETHSDHIVNRLVRRILEDDEYDLDKKIAIYFVSNSDDGAIVEEVVIDPLKGIVNWPEGFFDQTAIEQEKIIMAGINKRKKAREK